jgi:AcrR family transcriptional regulator
MAYHHGDLRRVVLDAAIDVITAEGPAVISLRDLARRAGVSHAAPAHHFGDKAGLLTAIAVEGNELLAEYLAEPSRAKPIELREVGVRYVRFALDHPAHFEVMFRQDLYHRDAPELIAARERTGRLLREAVQSRSARQRGSSTDLAALAAWSLAHGFAALWLGENLVRVVGKRDPADVFRGIAGLLFAGERG